MSGLTPIDIKPDLARIPNEETVRLQLERILQSESFRGSESMRHLLTFLADKFLSGELRRRTSPLPALGRYDEITFRECDS